MIECPYTSNRLWFAAKQVICSVGIDMTVLLSHRSR